MRPIVICAPPRSAPTAPSPEVVPHLIQALEDQASAAAAGQALAKYTIAIEPQLGAALDRPPIGRAIPRILERLATQPAIELLLARFQSADPDIRAEVYRAL